MSEYIICTECQWIGTREDVFTRTVEEHDGLPPPYRISVFDVCPDCQGEDFNDVTICPDCKEGGVINGVDDDGERCTEHASEHLECMAEDAADRREDR